MSSYIHQTQSTNKDTEYMSANGPPDLDHNSPQHALASARMQGLQNPADGDQSGASQTKPRLGAGAVSGRSPESSEDGIGYSPAVDNVMKAESRASLGDTGGSHYLDL
ncbi:hypothetical protein BDW72DRAFT_207749 [Aspergillus terricola var. indicus]